MNTKLLSLFILIPFVLAGCGKESAQVKEAFTALGKLDAGTQVGINRPEYSLASRSPGENERCYRNTV